VQKSDRLTLRVAPEENSPVTPMLPTQRQHSNDGVRRLIQSYGLAYYLLFTTKALLP